MLISTVDDKGNVWYEPIPPYQQDLTVWKHLMDIIPYNHPDKQDICYYVSACRDKGFITSKDDCIACARRWLAGKRKVSPVGARRRKEQEKAKKKLLSNIPQELLTAIASAKESKPYQQYLEGNDKALNSVVGMVMKQYRSDASLIKELLSK
jgi:hypothetical protein